MQAVNFLCAIAVNSFRHIFFTSSCCCFQSQQQPSKARLLPFVTATNGACAFGFVAVRACTRRVNSVILLLSSNLYTRTCLAIASFCTCTVHAVSFFIGVIVVKLFRLSLFTSGCCCYGATAALQAFPFVTATNGASACGFVGVRA